MRVHERNEWTDAYDQMKELDSEEDATIPTRSDNGSDKRNTSIAQSVSNDDVYNELALAMRSDEEILRRTSSTRERIIEDAESAEALNSMVEMGGEIIKTDPRSRDFRTLLADMIEESAYFKEVKVKEEKTAYFARMFCGTEHALAENLLTTDFLADLLTIELLRFLALKVCLGCFTSTDEGDRMLALIPSKSVLDAWRSLVILPLMYTEVCEAMGADGPLDYEEEFSLDFVTKDKKEKVFNLDSYIWTLDTYETLYGGAPSVIFWPRVETELDSKGAIVYEDQEPGTKPDWKLTLSSLQHVINDTIEIKEGSFDEERSEIPRHVKLKSKQRRRR